MKKLFKTNSLLKTIVIIIAIVYAVITLINQQKKLQSYANTKQYYEEKIAEQQEHNKTLVSTKENLDSDEYVEKIAREKLDMYYPNEKVYMDVAQ